MLFCFFLEIFNGHLQVVLGSIAWPARLSLFATNMLITMQTILMLFPNDWGIHCSESSLCPPPTDIHAQPKTKLRLDKTKREFKAD